MQELKSIRDSIWALVKECDRYNVVGVNSEEYIIDSLQSLHVVSRDVILDQYDKVMGGNMTWEEGDM